MGFAPQGKSLIKSLDGVTNPEGDIDLVEGTGVTITPDDANNQITIASSATPWTLIQQFSNSNSSTNIDFDTGVLGTTYDMYRIVGILENTSAFSLLCRINNLSTSDYDYTYYTASTVATNINQSYWRIVYSSASRPVLFDFIIIGNYESNPTDQYIQMIGNGGGGANSFAHRTLWGEYTAAVTQVNRIRVWSGASEDTTGRMNVYGLNF
jgi:hypothetical protein